MITSKNYIIEKNFIRPNSKFYIKESFSESYIPTAVTKITNILSKRLGVDIGIDPFPLESSLGGIAYKIVLDEDIHNLTFSLEFNGNNLDRIGFIGNYEDDTSWSYLDLQGYNIVQILDEIEAVLYNYISTGNFDFPIDYFDPNEESQELKESKLREGRAATATSAFDIWVKQNKKEVTDYLVNERIVNVYKDIYIPWAQEQISKGIISEIMSSVSFFNLSKKWLSNNKLENVYAHKSLIINNRGKLEYIENNKDTKNWRDLLTTTYQDQFELMKQMIDGIISGGLNSIGIFGPAGVGKTYIVQKYLNDKRMDYFTATGAIKDVRALVQILYEHKDNEIVVFDDLNISNKSFREVILAALDDKEDRVISYFDTKAMNAPKTKKIPEQFEFTSGVIYISNNPKIDPAIKSRTLTLELDLNPEEKMSLIYDSLKEIAPAIPQAIKEEVFEFMLETLKNLKLVDFRKFKQAIALYTLYKGKSDKWKPAVIKVLG